MLVNFRFGHVLALGSLATLCVVGDRSANAQAVYSGQINPGLTAWDNSTLTAAVQTLQGQVATLQGQLANANTQIADLQGYTRYVEEVATCGDYGSGQYQGMASYENFLANPGYFQNVTLKYCYHP
jgi:hypothetical protein